MALKLFGYLILTTNTLASLDVHVYWRSNLIHIWETQGTYWMYELITAQELLHVPAFILALDTLDVSILRTLALGSAAVALEYKVWSLIDSDLLN